MAAEQRPGRGRSEHDLCGRRHRIDFLDGRSEIYVATTDIKDATAVDLRLATDADDVRRARLEVRRDAGTLILDGNVDGKRVTARLARAGAPASLPMTRGFHWINEAPFIR